MDYATLIAAKTVVGSLADRVNYARIPAADLVRNAQDEIFARLRCREMRRSVTLPLALGDSTAPLPANFLDVDSLIPPFGGKVARISDDQLLARRATDTTGALIPGWPATFGIFDNLFQFDCAAAQAMTLRGLYYAAPYLSAGSAAAGSTPAVAAVNTSFLTDRYSNLFWAVLLKQTYGYRKDFDAARAHAADAESLFQQIEVMDDLTYRGLDDADYAGTRL